MPYKAIIHVAGINAFWFATQRSIRESVQNAMRLVQAEGFKSAAFPIIGAGSGSYNTTKALALMLEEFNMIQSTATVRIVRFRKPQ